MKNVDMKSACHRTLISIECCILAVLVASFFVGKLPARRKFVTTSTSDFTVNVANSDVLKNVISYGQVYFQTNEWRVSKAEYAVSFAGASLSNGMIRAVSPYPVRGFTLYLNFKPGTYDASAVKLSNARLNGTAIDLIDNHWGNPHVGFVSYAYTPESFFNGYAKEVLGLAGFVGLCAFALSGLFMRKDDI